MMNRNKSQNGFTLIEIIITLTVTAILSAIILQAMGTNVQRSVYPLVAVRNALSLQQVMENITADYKRFFLTELDPMKEIESRIDSGSYWNNDGSFSGDINSITFGPPTEGCPSAYANCFAEYACTENCHAYRLTITQTSTGRSLSALFTD
jgi:prepilin-type N-terminal cleavage/methylation domain-containing protein